jgi:hypothetical protein
MTPTIDQIDALGDIASTFLEIASLLFGETVNEASFGKNGMRNSRRPRIVDGRKIKPQHCSWIVYRRRRWARLDSRSTTAHKLRTKPPLSMCAKSKGTNVFESFGRLDPLTKTAEPMYLEWPLNPIDICLRCEAMTGTAEGLEALLQPAGYKHYNWYDLQYTARLGCRFCEFLWNISGGMRWRSTDGEYFTREEIRIFANLTARQSSSDVPTNLMTHPLRDSYVRLLRARIPANEDDPEQHLYPVTTDCE